MLQNAKRVPTTCKYTKTASRKEREGRESLSQITKVGYFTLTALALLNSQRAQCLLYSLARCPFVPIASATTSDSPLPQGRGKKKKEEKNQRPKKHRKKPKQSTSKLALFKPLPHEFPDVNIIPLFFFPPLFVVSAITEQWKLTHCLPCKKTLQASTRLEKEKAESREDTKTAQTDASPATHAEKEEEKTHSPMHFRLQDYC